MKSHRILTSAMGFGPGDVGMIVAVGPAQRRWPWWAMFARWEKPTHRIKATGGIVATLGRRRKRGWL